jgi:acyl-CoA reductase-like NAD-dependent aldehyde dehydrogenase
MTAMRSPETVPVEAHALVAGEWVAGRNRTEIRNPGLLSEVVGTVPVLDAGDVDRAVRAGASVQPSWAARSAADRAEIVVTAATAAAAIEGLPALLTREQGKLLAEAAIEVGSTVAYAQHYAGLTGLSNQPERRLSDSSGFVDVHRVPLGVVALITPFNWPYALTMTKLFPALIAGNSVMVKPAPSTPLAVIAGVRAFAERLPEGLVSMLTGGVDVPQALVTHPVVRMVNFTGSTATGRLVAAAAAKTIKNVALELGGNDAAVVLDDVEITPELCQKLVDAAFVTSGQVCFALKRLYVPNPILADVVAGIGEILDAAIIGPGLAPETTMAPLHNRQQRDILAGMVDDARSRGAAVRECGTISVDPDSGWFLRPVVASGLDDHAPLVAEEQFGPALPVLGYDTLDEAVARANGTEYGLTSSVWSADEERAATVAIRLQSGATAINNHGAGGLGIQAPFGGVKQSGVGRELSRDGLLAYTEPHAVALIR